EQPEVAALPLDLLVGAGEYEHAVVLGEPVLDAARDVGEEWVRDVEHDRPDGAAGAGPQLACRAAPHESELADRVLDPDSGCLGDQGRLVENVRHGADGNPGQLGDVANAPAP